MAVRNGHDVHPGANYVTAANVGFKKYLKFGNRDAVANNLKIGDIVERHIIDGE
jgi:DNA-directed RNA polymerase III subunit RPC1